MPLEPTLLDLTIRVVLTAIAAGVIGFERGERGRAAGPRTTLLVGLAACFSMILANLLLDTRGKAADGFVNIDVMRLPLGILTGVGFIGGGVILRQGDRVVGVTTAASMWYVTVVGLCFGAGVIWAGVAAAVLGVATVQALGSFEARLSRDRYATLTIEWDRSMLDRASLEQLVLRPPFRLEDSSSEFQAEPYSGKLEFALRWRAPAGDHSIPPIVETLAATDGVRHVTWRGSLARV
ncbi:MAG TPA: MgtC/SapB family protein [Devosiaceae bacterium]|nr:MgtC/SapB family protein [Devosiaceae bacterium]